jgi:hypothetical protein
MTTLEFDDGKYILYWDEASGRTWATRNGEAWRELSGDSLIFFMMMEILYYRKNNP